MIRTRNPITSRMLIAMIMVILFGCNDPQHGNIRIVNHPPKPMEASTMIKDLQAYKTDPLLYDLLKTVVSSNQQNYDPNKYFYSLTWGIATSHRQLTIIPAQWDAPSEMNYKGIIKVTGINFLLAGDIGQDTIFFKKDTGKKIRVKILRTRKDDLLPLPIEPILQGMLNNDTQPPVYVEVYTKSPIAGYDMRVNGKKIIP